MKLLVHSLGAWLAVEAASGRFSRPVAVGLAMLVSRLGGPTAALTLAGFAIKQLHDAGAFDGLKVPQRAHRRLRER